MSTLLGVYLCLREESVSKIAKAMCLTSAEYTKTLVSLLEFIIIGYQMSYMRDLGPHDRVHETLGAVDQLLYDMRPLFMPRAWKQLCLKLFDALEVEVMRHLKKYQHHDYYSAVYVSFRPNEEVATVK